MNSTKCFLYGAKGKSKDRFAQNLKVANRSFSVVETLSGGSSKRIHARAAGGMIMPPKGSTQRGAPLGDSWVTFSSGRKSPGARGWKHRQGEECRGRGAAPPRIGGRRGCQPRKSPPGAPQPPKILKKLLRQRSKRRHRPQNLLLGNAVGQPEMPRPGKGRPRH